MKNIRICIITGLSGSGKSTAMAALEDAGFYCVDNMPVDLLPKFLELPMERDSEIAGFALVMDLREKGFLGKYQSIFSELKQKGQFRNSFSGSRRRNPGSALQHNTAATPAIAGEKSARRYPDGKKAAQRPKNGIRPDNGHLQFQCP